MFTLPLKQHYSAGHKSVGESCSSSHPRDHRTLLLMRSSSIVAYIASIVCKPSHSHSLFLHVCKPRIQCLRPLPLPSSSSICLLLHYLLPLLLLLLSDKPSLWSSILSWWSNKPAQKEKKSWKTDEDLQEQATYKEHQEPRVYQLRICTNRSSFWYQVLDIKHLTSYHHRRI